MNSETILDIVHAKMEQVAEAMNSISAYMETATIDETIAFRGKFQVDIIENSYEGMRCNCREAFEFIREHWNFFLDNELYQQYLRECVIACREFRAVVEEFDECFSQNLDIALTIFSNEWIARRYLEMVLKMRDKCSFLVNFVSENFKERIFVDNPYKGSARRFRAYFVGVSDDNLRSLVENKVPLPRRAKWLGDRREATIFGKTLGLKCSLMNKSFLFPTREGLHRDLNYSSDGTSLNYNSYDISPILDSLITVGGIRNNL